jgi:hypothetical protein
MPSVNFTRIELTKRRRDYALIADALAGEPTVKSKKEKYLPPPQPLTDDEGKERYTAYLTRAVFYNVTKRTQQGLVGQLFNRAPQIEVPDYLQNTVGNMNGLGVNATQQAKGTSAEVISFGRAGLLSDFPTIEEGREVTREDLISGRVAPTVTFYDAGRVINWRYSNDRSANKLLFVILEERREIWKDGDYSFTLAKQYRVLRLDQSGLYVQELYYDNNSDAVFRAYPTDFNGNRLNYIPFDFIGSEDNDPDIDEPPMYSIASINMAHYRNSADFEDSTFYVGQPTTIITGLSQPWLDKNLSGGVRMGSRVVLPLPAGADIKVVQADPNTLAATGMEQKERQMVALGAKLVEQKQVQRTATEASQEEAAETSVLSTCADNTSVAYAQALRNCGRFVSNADAPITFKINTAFEISTMDAQSRQETVKEWQMGAIAFPEMRQVLRRGGIATLSDNDAKKAIAEDEKLRALAAAAADPSTVNDPVEE